jgi:pyruvate,water dikinase
MSKPRFIIPFEELRMADVDSVGGKNASLGEMISQLAQAGVRVPGGFATTAAAYREFLSANGLAGRIEQVLSGLDVDDVTALAAAGAQIRQWILETQLPARLESEIGAAYQVLVEESGDGTFAVRSSATAEDLPDASFAGQQETFLNIHGLDNVLLAVRHVFASLYNDRAISYRVHKGFVHSVVALSAGVQRMVRSDQGASGVMFTLDTESGFDKVVFITSAYGLGETVVQGQVNPDEFYVYKPALETGRPAILRRNLGTKALRMVFTDSRAAGRSVQTLEVPESELRQFSISDREIEELGRYAMIIEKHYGRPMDIEWGRDGVGGKLYILQARPETVKAREETQERFRLKKRGDVLVTGRAIGNRIGTGTVRLVKGASEMNRVKPGDVLVTDMTDPDWEPVMKKASAIVTNRGGRTCHAAIIARELGIPAVVGCGDATTRLEQDEHVTVSCAEGDTGYVYRGILDVEVLHIQLDKLPKVPVKISMNVGNPELAFDFQRLPNAGIGLARLEFIIARMIGVRESSAGLPEGRCRTEEGDRRARGGLSGPGDFLCQLTEGIATLGRHSSKPVIVACRISNPTSIRAYRRQTVRAGGRKSMLGFRGASRYVADSFATASSWNAAR